MKPLLLSLALVAPAFLPGHVAAQALPLGTASACPGRVAVIEESLHPTVGGDQDHRIAWAQRTQAEIDACVTDGTISRPYGYYLGLKVMGRMVLYFCLTGDDNEKRNALGSFDRTVIETRPALVGSTFSSLVDELQQQVHADCR